MDDTLACNGEYQTFIVPGFNAGINYTWQCSDWETDNITGDTVTVHWQYPGPPPEPVTSTILLITNGGCPDTTAIALQLFASPASCPKGIVYFEPQGLAILDPAAHYFQWGRLIGTEFVADPSRTDQTTFDAGHIMGCDTIPYYVVRTSIDGQQCWSTTLFCATPESIGRDCDQGGMILEGMHVRVYPNPSGGGPVTLEAIGESEFPLRIDLADARGRSILTRQLPLNGVSTLVLDLASLEPGIYLLRAWNTETDHMIKLVID